LPLARRRWEPSSINTKGKEKRQEDADEGGSGHNSKKKKTKKSCKDPLVAAAERKNPRAPPEVVREFLTRCSRRMDGGSCLNIIFDGSLMKSGAGAGLVFISPSAHA
jgi:hypothetical protein